MQKECQDCCKFDHSEENEVNNDRGSILKASRNINGGDFNQTTSTNEISFIDNNPFAASLTIVNPKTYEKLKKGERLHQIIEPMTSFTNKNLFEIVKQLLAKVVELHRSSPQKNSVYTLFEKCYRDLINKKIIENLNKSNLGYFTKIKFNLLYIIEIISELYHYLGYHLSNGREPYNIYYWDYIKNPVSYMKDRIKELEKYIKDINNFVIENKLKNLNHSVDIHITTNNFNIQMEQ